MKIINKKVKDLIPYINNPRSHNDIDKIASSIKNFGIKQPIVIDSKNEIVVGHGRLLACKKLKIKEIPCVVANDLTDEQIKAYRIADNKVSEFSEWDEDVLKVELENISSFTGFDEFKDYVENNDNNEFKEKEEKPDIEFTEILNEEHNYIVLYFDNMVDWLQAETLFDLKTVQAFSTRNDGKISKGMIRKGIGRVIDGKTAINKLRGEI